MPISYWSSDVCSSALFGGGLHGGELCGGLIRLRFQCARGGAHLIERLLRDLVLCVQRFLAPGVSLRAFGLRLRCRQKIARASCRERSGPYVTLSAVAVTLQKKK